jgi:hypothetical protein
MIFTINGYHKYNNKFMENNVLYSLCQSKIIKKYDLKLYFLKNHTLITTTLCILTDSILSKNRKLKKYDIVLLTIYCISIIEKENKKESLKLYDEIKKKSLDNDVSTIIEKFKSVLIDFNIKYKKPIRTINDIYNENLLSEFIIYIRNISFIR